MIQLLSQQARQDKTETVYQLDRYRLAGQRSEPAPALLFNEADRILGIRQEGAQRSVDKMENSIQSIILQEMESLDGILIATTNHTQNLDPAFERRFLYKICFERPDASVREKIWHTTLPALSSEERAVVAAAYDMSGAKKMLYSYRIVKRIMAHIALAALLQQFLPNFDHGEGVKFTVT